MGQPAAVVRRGEVQQLPQLRRQQGKGIQHGLDGLQLRLRRRRIQPQHDAHRRRCSAPSPAPAPPPQPLRRQVGERRQGAGQFDEGGDEVQHD